MHAEILKVGLRYYFAECVRHGAYAQLKRGTVGDHAYYTFGDGLFLRGRVFDRKLRQRAVLALNYVIDFVYIDRLAESAAHFRQVFVDFNYYNICDIEYALCYARGARKIKITVFVHWRYADHRYIDG